MKRVVAGIVLVVFALNCGLSIRQKTHSQREHTYPIRPSKEVGDVIVIDAEKREELGLFPGIEGFKEAHFNVISGGAYSVEIITETKRLVSFNNDPDVVTILLDYIDNYEEIESDRKSFTVKWGILAYDTLGLPITKHEVGRNVDSGHAVSCGCTGGALAAVAAGTATGVICAISASDGGGYDMSAGIGIMVGGVLLTVGAAVITGLTTGCLTGISVYKQDKKKVVEMIKERRKPRLLE